MGGEICARPTACVHCGRVHSGSCQQNNYNIHKEYRHEESYGMMVSFLTEVVGVLEFFVFFTGIRNVVNVSLYSYMCKLEKEVC